MTTALFWLALTTLIAHVALTIDAAIGMRSIRFLRDVIAPAPDELPPVSIVVAARDEERAIEPAMRSLLGIGAPLAEIVAVDDRSTDRTGEILDRLAAEHPALTALHLEELPDGWIGKNHALWRGARAARHDLILFTDADIVMEPGTLARAVAWLEGEARDGAGRAIGELDHLTIAPDVRMRGWLLPTFMGAFHLLFCRYARPWKASDPRSRAHVGIGAFSLVRRSAYERAGTFERIRMRPDDDMRLGKILKRSGARQECGLGKGCVSVEWYRSWRELERGLEKNLFAGLDYSVPLTLLSVVATFLAYVFPFLGVILTDGATQLLNAGSAAVLVASAAAASVGGGLRPHHALGLPLAMLLFLWLVLRTMCLNLWRGGVEWRGRRYPLRALRSNRV